jgi:DNA-binding MurR/RpiR family transcriptional regulator
MSDRTTTAHPFDGFGSIRAEVEARLPELSKKQQLVAEYVLENPTRAVFATAVDLARWAEVDPATVVRFAQRLGFSGHSEFRDKLRAEFSTMSSPLDRLDDEIGAAGGDLGQIVASVRAQTLANVERTFDQLDQRALSAVLDVLLAADRCVLVGAGQSQTLTYQLQRVLQTAGIKAERLDDWSAVVFEVGTFGPNDVAFGVAVWHYSKSTVEGLRLAHEAGATIVLLTDISYAPGAEFADHVLLFAPQAIGEYLSPAAGAAVVDCVAAGLAARVPDRVKQAMADQYELAVAFGLSYR